MGLLANLLVRTIPRLGAQAVGRWGRALRGVPAMPVANNGTATVAAAVARLRAAQHALDFKPCEILKSKTEIDNSSRFLREHGLILNSCDAKNWDLAHLLPRLGNGNLLDMGCQGSLVLDNALRLGLIGDKVGIDLAALPPRPGMRLIQGDLTKTGLPAQTFDYITCLSVIEHGVDVQAFVHECARLLKPDGRLFLTFDYWDPKIKSDLRMFDLPWNLFCRDEVENLIGAGAAAGMTLAAPMDWTQRDGVIHPGNWAPGDFAYTFGIVEFVKTASRVSEPPSLPDASQRCKLLQTRAQVDACTLYLEQAGYVPHSLGCKNWDLAHIIPAVGDGNFLDMGSSDSYILKNLARKRIRGELYGIDLRAPDVPVSGVKYLIGDLMHTPLPDGHFSNITCLSVLEHQVDYDKFAAEAARLLAPGGRVFVTFDYWEPQVVPLMQLYGLDWLPLDAAMVRRFIASCARQGLEIECEFDFTAGDPVIDGGYYSPHPDVSYTFGMAVFRKR
jgi:2-polyprenyl-3-methyl-5-hydroxy-6-metoxy-1,4-benzoquinol methylase